MEIAGFKSFDVDRVKITLDPGLTVLTGPIGSGKSNVVDAIRFALCEPNPRVMRVSNLGELLYETPSRKSTFAWVKAVLDNSDSGMAIGTRRVEIKRKLSAKGSTYLLQGRRVSRKRLIQFLEASGIYPGGFNFVAQGTIIRVAEVELKELKRILEELTGIAIYDQRKREAWENLSQADHKIAIAEARIEEVRDRLKNLEKERNSLLSYRQIRDRIRELMAVGLSSEIIALEAEVKRLDRAYGRCALELEKIKSLEDDLMREHALIEAEIEGSEITRKKLRFIELEAKIEQEQRNLADIEGRIERHGNDLKRIRAARTESLRALSHLELEIGKVRKEIKGAEEKKETLLRELRDKSASVRRSKIGARSVESAIASTYDRIAEVDVRIAVERAKNEFSENQLEHIKRRKDEIQAAIKRLEELLKGADEILQRENRKIGAINRTIDRHVREEKETKEALRRIAGLTRKVRDAAERFSSQRELINQLATEESVLEKVTTLSRDGVVGGVYGEINGLIEISPPYKKALLASSDGWHRAIVVEDMASGLQLLRRLNDTGTGTGLVRVISLRDVKVKPIDKPDFEGVVGIGSSFIDCDQKFRRAVELIWGDTLVTTDDDIALFAASKGHRSVTVDGNVYEPQGVLIRGFREPAEPLKLLPSARAIRRLRAILSKLERVLARYSKEVDTLAGRIERSRIHRETKLGEVRCLQTRLSSGKRHLNQSRKLLSIIVRRSRQISNQLERERERISKLGKRKASLEERLVILKGRRNLSAEIENIRASLAKTDGLITSLERTLTVELRPRIKDVKAKLSNAQTEIQTVEGRLEAAQTSLLRTKEKQAELSREKATLGAELSRIEDSSAELKVRLSIIKDKLGDIRKRRNEIAPRATHLHTELALKRKELESLLGQLRDLGFESVLRRSEEEVKRAARTRTFLEAELKEIGEVNHLAAKQYHELMGRYRLISERINGLERDKRAILQFIDSLEKKKRRVFMDAFKKVNNRFGDFFARLTGNGRALLKLQNEDDPFEGDIDMLVQFPGKNMILVSGASGGEKSVAVVSFILALSELMKAPFYVFDEIDVHLDQFHIERLANVLREQSSTNSSQIIIVSRRSPILSKADRVYGFYIRDGRSRVVSLPSPVIK